MKPDEHEVCVCFHVPLAKLVNYYHIHKPPLASQFSQCHGAGTGCGWCVPFLERLHEKLVSGQSPDLGMTQEEYHQRRLEYKKALKGTMPDEPDANGKPLELDLDEIYREIPEDEKLD